MSDLISRQAAIGAINDLPDCPNGFSDTYDKSCIIGVLEQVPSAPSKRNRDEKGGRTMTFSAETTTPLELIWQQNLLKMHTFFSSSVTVLPKKK